jgi:hypothetical protein
MFYDEICVEEEDQTVRDQWVNIFELRGRGKWKIG